MHKFIFKQLILTIAAMLFNNIGNAQQNLTQFVNPFIGTGGHGHTFPGATTPFGMMQLSPDTRLDGWDGCSGYHYDDSIIYGFSHTHLSGTGCSDYGDILLMPTNHHLYTIPKNYASGFSHANEKASAGYYKVHLNKPNIDVQLTTTDRCGMHNYQFGAGDSQLVFLDLLHRDEVLDSELEILYPNKIKGYRFSKAWAKNQKVYFEIEFNKPFTDITFYNNDSVVRNPYLHSKNIKALFAFGKSKEALLAKIGISAVSAAGAAANLAAEMTDFNFEKYKKLADAKWQKQLEKITLKKPSTISNDDKIKFYTALYHCAIQPNIYQDVNGAYRGMDDKIYNTKNKFTNYTVFSIWDTYRAWNPLMTILDTALCNNMINTFLAQYDAVGKLPIWELSANETNCMIGNHAVSIIWDAYSKGIRQYDATKAYLACKAMAMDTSRADIKSIETYGYIRTDDDHESVSKTLEIAYDDWCLAQLGNSILQTKKKSVYGNFARNINVKLDIKDTDKFIKDSLFINELEQDVAYFNTRSQNWKNIFDQTTGFMRAIKNGTLYEPFSPYTVDNNYTEANSWQYSFYVPHDIPSMINMYGGKKNFTKKLDDLFAAKTQTEGRQQADITGLIGQYAHGNEPSHHIAYLYNYSTEPQKRMAIVDKIMQEMYTTQPDGYIGNEDCGQMSAWYVMSALGLYQIAPGSMHYEYDAAKLNQWNILNKDIHNITNATVFDELHKQPTQQLLSNAANAFIANPYIINAPQIFKDSVQITMQCNEPNAYIFYSINKQEQKMYVAPFSINTKSSIEFYSAKDILKSATQQANFYKIPTDKTVKLNCTYNKSYSGGGPDALIDGIAGDANWRKGNWQGYQSQDFEAIITFNKPKQAQTIAAEFLADQNSWIFYPAAVEYWGSANGKDYVLLHNKAMDIVRQDDITTVQNIKYNLTTDQKKSSYTSFKVIAKNIGKLPTWHRGFGDDAFIFIDEIEIK